MSNLRKGSAIILTFLVLFFSIMSLLGIWEIIDFDLKDIFTKSVSSLFIIFIACAIVLFIFSVIFKPGDNGDDPKPPPIGR